MRITISDIAKMAKVSKATVSRVINNKPEGVGSETRERILALVEETGFQPSMIARGLVTKRTKSIGLIIPDITNPFFPQLVRGVEDHANALGYHVFLCNSDKSVAKEENYIHALVEKSVDGIILTSNISTADSQFNLLKQRNIHCVLLDRYVEYKDYEAGVYLDNIAGARTATEFLLNHGHKEIVFIAGPLSVATSVNRLKGFEAAHHAKGIPVNYSLVLEGDYLTDSGYKHMIRLLEEGRRFTAIFAANDMMAVGAMNALKSKKIRIPQDVEVIGFDDIEISRFVEPALSTVAQPAYEMGVRGVKLLIKLIEGGRLKAKNVVLTPELVIRGSTREDCPGGPK